MCFTEGSDPSAGLRFGVYSLEVPTYSANTLSRDTLGLVRVSQHESVKQGEASKPFETPWYGTGVGLQSDKKSGVTL